MNFTWILTSILFGLAVAVSCSAKELPAINYIDGKNIDEQSRPYLDKIGELIENFANDNDAKGTLGLLKEVKDHLWNLWHSLPLDSDKYHLAAAGYKKLQLNHFHSTVGKIVNLIENTKDYYGTRLETFLDLIKLFFGNELDVFANNQPINYKKLHAFLYHYGPIILSNRIEKALSVDLPVSYHENSLVKAIAHNLGPDYTDDELISRAQELDLVEGNFDARAMLKAIESYQLGFQLQLGIKLTFERLDHQEEEEEASDQVERLSSILEETCRLFSDLYRREIETFIWARLLIPGRIISATRAPSKRLLIRTEFWRVCLPVNNKETFKLVVANIGQIMTFASPSSSELDESSIILDLIGSLELSDT